MSDPRDRELDSLERQFDEAETDEERRDILRELRARLAAANALAGELVAELHDSALALKLHDSALALIERHYNGLHFDKCHGRAQAVLTHPDVVAALAARKGGA